MSWLARFLAADRSVRIVAADVTSVVAETVRIHELNPGAAQLCAECSAALGVLSAYVKGEDRVVVQVQGEKPACSYYGDLDGLGGFRARVSPSFIGSRASLDAMLGVMMVQKHNAERELYRGMTAIDGESIASALRQHLAQSNQIMGVLQLDVVMGDNGVPSRAGAVWVERMPGDKSASGMDRAEFLARFGPVADTPLPALLDGMAFGVMLGETIEPLEVSQLAWNARMDRAKVEAMLRSLGADQLQNMLDEDGGAEVIDQFSREAFQFDADELRALIAALASGSGG